MFKIFSFNQFKYCDVIVINLHLLVLWDKGSLSMFKK